MSTMSNHSARISFCWGFGSGAWWLVTMLDGEPAEAFHQQHGRIKAYRDTFTHWTADASVATPELPPSGPSLFYGHGVPETPPINRPTDTQRARRQWTNCRTTSTRYAKR